MRLNCFPVLGKMEECEGQLQKACKPLITEGINGKPI